MRTSPCSHSVALVTLAALVVLAAGCSSPKEAERPVPPAAAVDLPPIMAGTENFADGRLTIKVTLAMSGNFHLGKDGALHGDLDGGRPGGGGRHRGADEPPPGSGGAGLLDDNPRPVLTGSTLPPAQLKIYLQNNSPADAIDCEIEDFNSYLGDFAVFPARYRIEAGQSAASEAMTSRLGVEGDEIPVTVAVRVGDHKESKVVTMRLLNPPANAPH